MLHSIFFFFSALISGD